MFFTRFLRTIVFGLFCLAGTCAYAGPFTHKNSLGDVMMVMAPAYALGMAFMSHDYEGMLQLGSSVFTAQMAVESLKLLELETRPDGSDKKSFPSGHAAGAFSGAMFVHKRYGWKPALVPYGMSLVASWARVSARAHYWHDVAAGAAISALFTWIFVSKYMPDGVSVSADSESVKLGFNIKF